MLQHSELLLWRKKVGGGVTLEVKRVPNQKKIGGIGCEALELNGESVTGMV